LGPASQPAVSSSGGEVRAPNGRPQCARTRTGSCTIRLTWVRYTHEAAPGALGCPRSALCAFQHAALWFLASALSTGTRLKLLARPATAPSHGCAGVRHASWAELATTTLKQRGMVLGWCPEHLLPPPRAAAASAPGWRLVCYSTRCAKGLQATVRMVRKEAPQTTTASNPAICDPMGALATGSPGRAPLARPL
jgi:hypothetical protein